MGTSGIFGVAADNKPRLAFAWLGWPLLRTPICIHGGVSTEVLCLAEVSDRYLRYIALYPFAIRTFPALDGLGGCPALPCSRSLMLMSLAGWLARSVGSREIGWPALLERVDLRSSLRSPSCFPQTNNRTRIQISNFCNRESSPVTVR